MSQRFKVFKDTSCLCHGAENMEIVWLNTQCKQVTLQCKVLTLSFALLVTAVLPHLLVMFVLFLYYITILLIL